MSNLKTIAEQVIERINGESITTLAQSHNFCVNADKLAKACLLLMEKVDILERMLSAKDKLLVCYRLEKPPSNNLFKELDDTKEALKKANALFNGSDGGS